MKKLSIISTIILFIFFGIKEIKCQNLANGLQSVSSLKLNGSGGRVIIPGSVNTDISQGSYGAWVKFNSFGSTYQRIIYKEANVELFYFEPMKRFEAEIVVGAQRFEVFTDSLTFKIDTAEWYHLMVTYDTSDFKIYVNGNLESVNSSPRGPIKSQPNSWGIGASPSSGAWSFNGEIDEVTLFNRALNAIEVNSLLCNQIDTNNSLYSSLLAYYKFDENNDTIASDEIYGNDGVLNTGVSWIELGMPNFKPHIIINNNNLSSNISGVNYQWYLDGNQLIGDTNQIYSATQNGDYYIEVASQYGCIGASDVESFVLTGVDDINVTATVEIYPNPTKGLINFLNSNNIKTISIFDISGKEVLTSTGSNHLDISYVEKGIYIVKILTKENQAQIFKLFKQ
ncbi:MAG: T9SS type A sorting domain-containing protein [Flavobacteriales bacterium]|nr:T9SS type A sorting domain-containing protein [Flavobacteriales bacterium]